MEFGRREFLKFLSLATAGAAVKSLPDIIRNDNYFINTRLGFGFNTPEDWEVEAFTSFESMKEQQILISDDSRSEYQKELIKDLEDLKGLSVVLKKYPDSKLSPEGQNIFSPSITFFMEEDDTVKDYENLVELCKESHIGFSQLLSGYECYEAPEEFSGKNYKAARSKSSFLFEAENMIPTIIDDEMLCIHYGDILYSIHMYDSPYINDTAQDEFKLFKGSLHII